MAHTYNEAGRRLLASVLSYQLGIKVDYCLKKYVPEEVDRGWAELAQTLLIGISEGVASQLLMKWPSNTQSKILLDFRKVKPLTNKVQ
jgi:hypothetical protein